MYPTRIQGLSRFHFGITVSPHQKDIPGCFSAHLFQILQNPHQSTRSEVFIVLAAIVQHLPAPYRTQYVRSFWFYKLPEVPARSRVCCRPIILVRHSAPSLP